jgi:deoxyribodipyrimidine photo-lyase
VKQAQDHDPPGMFVRRWLPYMRDVPDTWLFEPSLMPQNMLTHASVVLQIPKPVVDLALATRSSKQMLHARRQTSEVKAGKNAVVEKHASRQTFRKRTTPVLKHTSASNQLGFDF